MSKPPNGNPNNKAGFAWRKSVTYSRTNKNNAETLPIKLPSSKLKTAQIKGLLGKGKKIVFLLVFITALYR